MIDKSRKRNKAIFFLYRIYKYSSNFRMPSNNELFIIDDNIKVLTEKKGFQMRYEENYNLMFFDTV